MKNFCSIVLLSILAISVSAQQNKFNSGIFLHHSTGYHIWGPNDTTVSVPLEIDAYNKSHNLKDSSAFSLTELAWPQAPDNEWVRWYRIFNNKDTTSDIRPILAANKIVIIKSCFPSSQMTGVGSIADTLTPDEKTIYNYKRYLRSIADTMKHHPDNFFVIWTNAPLVPRVTTDLQASLSDKFCTWMKDTLARGRDSVFGAFPKNIYVFDFFHKMAGPDGKLKLKYAVDSLNSHPNGAATVDIAPQFVKEIFDAILASYNPPVMSVSRSSINFGDRPKGITIPQSVVVKNSSLGQLVIDSVKTHTRWFTPSLVKANVVYNDSTVISVAFAPDSIRSYADTLFLYTNATPRVTAIPLSGTSSAPRLTAWPIGFAFPDAASGDSTQTVVTVYNKSINVLTIQAITASTPHYAWSVALPLPLQPNDSLLISVRFKPKGFGTAVDTLSIRSDGGIAKIALQGSSPWPQVNASHAALDFGTVMKTMTGMKELAITNGAINKLSIDSIATRNGAFQLTGVKKNIFVTKKDTLKVRIAFMPDSVMSFSDTLTVYSNAQTPVMKVPLTGIGEKLTSVERDEAAVPAEFALAQNYPNPFNPSTTIKFGLAERSSVSLAVYDITGRVASVLAQGDMPAGSYTAVFDASRLASGVYFYRIHALHNGSVYTVTKRLILMK